MVYTERYVSTKPFAVQHEKQKKKKKKKTELRRRKKKKKRESTWRIASGAREAALPEMEGLYKVAK